MAVLSAWLVRGEVTECRPGGPQHIRRFGLAVLGIGVAAIAILLVSVPLSRFTKPAASGRGPLTMLPISLGCNSLAIFSTTQWWILVLYTLVHLHGLACEAFIDEVQWEPGDILEQLLRCGAEGISASLKILPNCLLLATCGSFLEQTNF